MTNTPIRRPSTRIRLPISCHSLDDNAHPKFGGEFCHWWDDRTRRFEEVGGMPRVPFGTMHHVETIASPMLAVAKLAAYGARRLPRSPRAPRGLILRPGPETPRWNALAQAAAKLLRRRGDKAQLARI